MADGGSAGCGNVGQAGDDDLDIDVLDESSSDSFKVNQVQRTGMGPKPETARAILTMLI